MSKKITLTDAIDNQLQADEFWEVLKTAIILGKPFLFKLEEGVVLQYDEDTHTATIKSAPKESV